MKAHSPVVNAQSGVRPSSGAAAVLSNRGLKNSLPSRVAPPGSKDGRSPLMAKFYSDYIPRLARHSSTAPTAWNRKFGSHTIKCGANSPRVSSACPNRMKL